MYVENYFETKAILKNNNKKSQNTKPLTSEELLSKN